MNVSVLGCGRWGSFIAWYLNKLGFSVTLWGRPGSARLKALCETRDNGLLTFPSTVKFTDDLKQAVSEAELLFISISAQSLRTLTASLQPLLPKNTPVILCMKGIEEATGLRLTQIVGEFISAPSAVWVGPGHVQDFLQGIPNYMVIDSQDDTLKQRLVPLLSSELIRFYYGTDLIGSEVGAAAKNVVGIAAGMLDGLDQSSLKGALMSRGTREIARLIESMGGNGLSAYGLCHLGDYQATLFSQHSHNRRFGELFIRHEPYGELAEGASTVRALCLLGQRLQVDLPICQAVDQVVHRGEDPSLALSGLFLRTLKNEF